MVKRNSIWFLPVLAFAVICLGQTFAQEKSELTSLTVAEDKAGDKDACDKGCTFVWGEDTWLTVGAGLRTSYRKYQTLGLGPLDPTNNFNIDNARIYLNGRGHDCLGMEFNTDIDNAQNFWDASLGPNHSQQLDSADVRVLDAIVKFEFNDLVNIWMGRMIPPSDRTNLSGPYYMNSGWDFPFTQFGYNNIFQGRDDGAAFWGQLGGGSLKYQVGVYEGTNGLTAAGQETLFNGIANADDLMIAGRFTVNLLDPESGYYNASTYHGEKDILALGYAFMNQTASDALGTYSAWNFDLLYETTLGSGAVATIAGAYYDFTNSFPNPISGVDHDGSSYFMEASYLTARSFNLGACVSGRISLFWRHQEFRWSSMPAINRQTDWGFHYVMSGHNARMTYVYSALRNSDVSAPPDEDRHIVGMQLQY